MRCPRIRRVAMRSRAGTTAVALHNLLSNFASGVRGHRLVSQVDFSTYSAIVLGSTGHLIYIPTLSEHVVGWQFDQESRFTVGW